MKQADAQKLAHGLYRIYFKAGGMSEAAIGSLYDGRRWFAPTNWVSKTPAEIASTKWRLVDYVENAD